MSSISAQKVENKASESDSLPEEWKTSRIRDLIRGFHQGINTAADKVEYSNLGYPILQSKHITAGFIRFSDARKVNESTYCKYKEKYNPQIDDILVCNIGTIGKNLIVKEEKKFLIAWNIFIIKVDRAKIEPKFFNFYLKKLDFDGYYHTLLGGSATKFVSKPFMGNIIVPLPQLREQEQIVFVLSTIQAAQEKSAVVIGSLEELKKSLMKHLFTYGPTSLQDSPKVVLKETDTGEVPEKWHIVKLSNVFKLTSGKERPKGIMSSKTALNFYPVYGGNGIMGYSKEKLLDKSAIIIGRVGEYCGVCYLSKEECWVSDNALYSKELLLSVNLDYLCLALEKLDLNRLKNTGGQPLISQSIVYSQSIPLPSNQDQEEIAKTISVIDRAIEAEQSNRKSLDNLFKSMLENLMSAKIRLNDLEF